MISEESALGVGWRGYNPQDRLIKKHPVIILFSCTTALLTGCGDGQPDSVAPRSFPLMSAFQERENAFWDSSSTAWAPLSSASLLAPLEKFSEPSQHSSFAELTLSSTLGDLPEKIVSTSERLGLVGDPTALQLTNAGGQLPSGFHWSSKSNQLSLRAGDSESIETLQESQLNFNDIPIYQAELKSIYDSTSNATTYLTGSMPRWLLSGSQRRPRVIEFSLKASEARSSAAKSLGFSAWRFHSETQVYLPEQKNVLHASYIFKVSAEPSANDFGPRVPLEVGVSANSGQILWQRPLALHGVSGTAQLYVENPKAANNVVSTVTLPNLQNDGSKLSHTLFDVFNCHQLVKSSQCDQKSQAVTDGNYTQVGYSDERYDEIVSYAAVTKAMSWFNAIDRKSLRTTWDESKWPGLRSNFGLEPKGTGKNGADLRLNIFVRTRTPMSNKNQCGDDSTPDNAQYLWAGTSGQGGPEILIGYGGYGIDTCGKLRELGKDMDVIMHEFGHHIIFRSLSNSKQQSVALHEGFADYFTYAITGNNLLAENSLPSAKALRQGNIPAGATFNRFKPRAGGGYYSVSDLLAAPHLVGEFWSGILWEIRGLLGKEGNGSDYRFDKIVWDAIDLLKSDAGIFDGVVALSESGKRYAEQTGADVTSLQKTVQDTFVRYGFARYTENGELAATVELATSSSTKDEDVTKVTKSRHWGCGQISAELSNGNHPGNKATPISKFALLLLVFPVLGSFSSSAFRSVALHVKRSSRRSRARD